MRVARLHGVGDLRLHDEPRPAPAAGETLVRIRAIGLCGSDLHWFAEGGIGDIGLSSPLVLGHEMAGVTDDGRAVAIEPAVHCGECRLCAEGHPNLCPAVRFAGVAPEDGGLRDWMAWPDRCLVPLPASFTPADGAMLEPLGVAIHAVDLAHLRPGAQVGVLGCGPIGLLTLQVARLAGASRLFATDLPSRPHRLEAARALGAEVLPADGGEGAALRDRTGGLGLDVVLEAAGEQAAVDAAVAAVRPGGRVVLVGIPSDDRTSFSASVARRKGLTIVLARRMKHTWARAMELVASGQVDVRTSVTHRFPLDAVADAFGVAARREGLKVVVEP